MKSKKEIERKVIELSSFIRDEDDVFVKLNLVTQRESLNWVLKDEE